MRRFDWISLLLLFLAAAMLWAAVTRVQPINDMRSDMDLEASNTFEDGDWSSELRIPTAALSVFRSLVIDYLWIRADNLKNDGQYFDALYLARMICALQPNLPSVWQFNAWNMAYNISVGLPSGPERWNWVRAGYELLRDRALVYNQTSMELYSELAWIFQHKIGGITDDENSYYKWRLASEMFPLMGVMTNTEVELLAESPRSWGQYSSAPFRERDFAAPMDLLLKIRDDENNTVARYIYNNLTPDFRERLGAFDEVAARAALRSNVVAQPDETIDVQAIVEPLLLDMMNEFNMLLLDENLYDAQRFANVELSEEIQELIGQNLRSWDRIPLNRLLIEAAFPAEITPQQRYRLDDDPDVAAVIEAMMQAEPGFESTEDVLAGIVQMLRDQEGFSDELMALMPEIVQNQNQAYFRLQRFERARLLRQEWKIDPVWILIINRMYGPINYDNPNRRLCLDWRSAFVHAIYWAERGLQYSNGESSFDELNLHRRVYHSLQSLFHYGNMQIRRTYVPPTHTETAEGQEIISRQPVTEARVYLSQDLRMFPVAYQATLDVIRTRTDRGEEEPSGVVDGSLNLLRSGITNLYLAGHEALARYYYRELRQRRPDAEETQGTLVDFVRARMRQEAEQIGPKGASDYINSLLRESFARYALLDDENAMIREQWAAQIHDLFEAEFTDEQGDRIVLLDMDELRWIALQDFFADPMTDPAFKGALLERMRIEAPQMYERVMELLERQMNAAPFAQ
ncbi:MAG: hypothetical protein JW936_06450 [Sedimentisphaerales bacterium]|nr:hypothetical protein [Sedimentisphaerales bacterium]